MDFQKLDGLNYYGGKVAALTEATASEFLEEGKASFIPGVEYREAPLCFTFERGVDGVKRFSEVFMECPIWVPEGRYKIHSCKKYSSKINVDLTPQNKVPGVKRQVAGLLVLSESDYYALSNGEDHGFGKYSSLYGVVDVLMMRRAKIFS